VRARQKGDTAPMTIGCVIAALGASYFTVKLVGLAFQVLS